MFMPAQRLRHQVARLGEGPAILQTGAALVNETTPLDSDHANPPAAGPARDLLSCAVALPAHLDRLARRDQS
jgi:hypothetical protein